MGDAEGGAVEEDREAGSAAAVGEAAAVGGSAAGEAAWEAGVGGAGERCRSLAPDDTSKFVDHM